MCRSPGILLNADLYSESLGWNSRFWISSKFPTVLLFEYQESKSLQIGQSLRKAMHDALIGKVPSPGNTHVHLTQAGSVWALRGRSSCMHPTRKNPVLSGEEAPERAEELHQGSLGTPSRQGRRGVGRAHGWEDHQRGQCCQRRGVARASHLEVSPPPHWHCQTGRSGKCTRNLTIFHDMLMDCVKKYGLYAIYN